MTFPRFGQTINRIEVAASVSGVSVAGWELIQDITVPIDAAQVDITGLSGDTDEQYLMVVSPLDSPGAGGPEIGIRLNGDSGANYNIQFGSLNGGTNAASRILAGNQFCCLMSAERADGLGRSIAQCWFRVTSGQDRKMIGRAMLEDDSIEARLYAGEWTNEVDEVTSINLLASVDIQAGTRIWLYRPVGL